MEDIHPIVTKPCAVTPQHYFGVLLRLWLQRNWWIPVLPVVALVLLSIQNLLFIYVSFMVIFVVMPMIFLFLWFSYTLHPDCRSSILTKRLELSESGILCTYEDERTESIPWERITRVRYTSSDIVLHFSRYTFFVLPGEAFESTHDLEYFIKKILLPHTSNKK